MKRIAITLTVLAILTTRPDDRIASFIEGLVRVELKGLSSENQLRLLQARLGVSEGVAQTCGAMSRMSGTL